MMGLLARVGREPVLTGAAVAATLEAALPNMGAGWKLAVGAWVALYQRAYSTPKATADEREAAAKATTVDEVEGAKYVGALEHQATVLAAQVPAPRPLRGRIPTA